MTQFFKPNDPVELKFYQSAQPVLDLFAADKQVFFDQAYSCFLLGELLYDNKMSPLAGAIPREVFRESFQTIFDSFVVAGTFESYLTVFRNIFGNDVEVTFTVPAPGKLQIAIVATGLVLSTFVARRIVDNEYVYDDVVDDEGDFIAFKTVKGFESQYELEQMLFELVPHGIFTQITLTLGG